jgi:hypothetical protein
MVLPPDMTIGVRWLAHRLSRGEHVQTPSSTRSPKGLDAGSVPSLREQIQLRGSGAPVRAPRS